jgi:hypothetical protein
MHAESMRYQLDREGAAGSIGYAQEYSVVALTMAGCLLRGCEEVWSSRKDQ